MSPSLWVGVFAIRADIHIRVVSGIIIFFLKGWPAFLAYQRIIVIILFIFFKKCLGGRWLRLVVLSAHISTYVFTLVKIGVVNVLLHAFINLLSAWSHHTNATTGCLISTVESIGICNILSMYATTTFYHWKLLCMEAIVWVRCESTTTTWWFFIKLFCVSTSSKIRKFLLGFSKLIITFFFIWINSFNLISASNLYFCTMSSHIIRVFAVLTQWVWECSSDTTLSKWTSILLFEHILLLPKLFEPIMFQSLGSSYSVIRIVN